MVKEQKNNFLFFAYLAGLSIVGFLATDMYLPAFDKMRIDLNTTKSNISATLSLFLAGYAIAQLVWGPISDKLGKRKTILMGLSIFMVSSFLIFFTESVMALLALRLVQAIGVCAAAVSWQALVIERYPANETNKVFASILPLVALSPALAPLLGALLLNYFNWRSIFITLAIIAFLLIVYTWTLKDGKVAEKLDVKDNLDTSDKPKKGYITLLKSKRYSGNVLIYGLSSAAFFAWLTGSPFFLKEMGYTESEIGLSFVPQTLAFLVGGYGYRALSSKIEGNKILPYLLILNGVGALMIFLIPMLMKPSLGLLLFPFCMMALSNGACHPIVVPDALKTAPDNLGKAAGMQNTIQLGLCFIASTVVSIFAKDALLITTIVMVSTVPLMFLAYRLKVSK